jgi:hypothetical protein
MENANFILMEDKVPVYATADSLYGEIAELNSGDEIIVDEKVKKNQTDWVSVVLSDGKTGFIKADVKGCGINLVILRQSSADVFEDSDASSKIVLTYHKGEKFQIIGGEKRGDVLWVKTESLSGVIGFINESVRIKEVILFTPSQKWPALGGYIGAGVGVAIVLYIAIISDSGQSMERGTVKLLMIGAAFGGLVIGYFFTYFFIKIKHSMSQPE